MKTKITHLFVAGAIALAAGFPVAASAEHGHGHDWNDRSGNRDDGDCDDILHPM